MSPGAAAFFLTEPGFSHIVRHPDFIDGTIPDIPDCAQQTCTAYSSGAPSATTTPGSTKKQAAEFVDHYGSGLDHTFAQFTDKKAGEQAPIGVYSCNRAEWHLTEFSTYRGNRYFYVLNHAEIESVFPALRCSVSMDALDGPPKNVIASETSNETISALKERAKALGHQQTPIRQRPPDLCSISYTSGTSGNPKGVLSTHGQFMKSANAVRLVITLVRPRLVSYFTLSKFGCIGYYSGKVPNFLEDIQALKPTLFAAVPRLLNRVYDKVSGAIGSATGIKGFLARTAVSHKLASFESSGSYRHALWDALVFNKVRAVLGGRIETLVVGSAPMDLEAIKFLQIAMCCVVIQGFGMTETNTCGMIETVEESVTNSVGRPKPGMSVRLRDCPEMNYQSTDKPCPRGELLLKGDAIMTGYYKNDELTKESFKDGWLYTGDIAQINPNGTISIIDRCKNIFKLHSLVQQTFVHGDSNRSALVAIVVPDPEAFVPWAREIAKDSSAELEALSSNPQKLQGFEIIRAIHIEPTPFDIDKNQLLSNTLKLKRHFAAQYYRETIDKLYDTLMAKPFIVPDSQEPGFSYVIRHPDYMDGTLYGLFQRCIKHDPHGNFFGTRLFDPVTRKLGHYQWMTKYEAGQFVDEFGSGMDWLFEKFTDKKAVDTYFVSLYDTLGADSVEYVLNQTQVEVLVCSIDKIGSLLDLKARVPSLQVIISMDSLDGPRKNIVSAGISKDSVADVKSRAESLGIALTDIIVVLQLDICSISYTSGTSGHPKGVVTKHCQFMKSVNAVRLNIDLEAPVLFSLIPLAHCFERLVSYFVISRYGSIGYFSGKVATFLDDIQALKPTAMGAVPRILNRIYDSIWTSINSTSGVKKFLAKTAVTHKMGIFESNGSYKHTVWDVLVFNRVKAVLGGRMRVIVVGSAPIDVDAVKFLQIAMCCTVIQGYAMTETNTCGAMETPDEAATNSVGRPKPGLSMRLRDCPELGYLSTDKPCPRGELLMKGDSIMAGYCKNDALTAETIKDGWLHSGDIAQFNANGTVTIIDRSKDIFKLAQGEYVAPEYLQIIYERHPLVQQIFIYGDPTRSALVAIVVPDPGTFTKWARWIASDDNAGMHGLCANAHVTAALLNSLEEFGRERKLQGFELVRALYCELTPFDITSNCLLSSTFKIKRNLALYSQLDVSHSQH
ncbi:acetyl-CoA synthetase-like protein [Linderina pennispora]|uniref:Acetyl-CoA synthetase-like protein n=1 Tax=Linderina pennispora TaxID=61395 RepID=A0A1Y1W098_9FUNG|nr:acetyl-CoA synthetase-like protein [Linderina pennispora]ORX66939.1 acetyl-CoA synthetase-like protein [Linderina pennispora]